MRKTIPSTEVQNANKKYSTFMFFQAQILPCKLQERALQIMTLGTATLTKCSAT